MAAPIPDLLDTNILVELIRDKERGERIRRERQPLLTEMVPAYCLVTAGEIRSLAYRLEWNLQKVEKIRYYLQYFRPISIDTPEMIEAYAVIDAYSHRNHHITMGKNDLWIAAAAHTTGFTLITTDKDFDHLDPAFLTHILVP